MREYSIEKRLEICDSCPIYSSGRCNSKLWINPENDDVSTSPKAGYIRGCNCLIKVKAKNPNNHCIAGKW